jgi:hypothetical protein
MELDLGSRSHNKGNAANVFNKYYLNITDELRIRQANAQSSKSLYKEVFPQGFPEIINIPITESEVKYTIKV